MGLYLPVSSIKENKMFTTTVWTNGKPNVKMGSGYGINIPLKIRENIFQKNWDNIELDLDGIIITIPLTEAFWNKCNEIRSSEIGKWLIKNNAHSWIKGKPTQIEMAQIKNNRFKASIKL